MSPPRTPGPFGWGWVLKVRILGGNPTVELFEEAEAHGRGAVTLLVDILSRREWREGEPVDCAPLPVHAMRLLGRLRSESAIPALVNVLCDPVDPSMYGEEAGIALARIGGASLAPLEGVLRDPENGTWPRVYAARGLCYLAIADRRQRPRVRAAFERILLDPRETDRNFSANIALGAVTLAMLVLLPAIEIAYASGRIDEDVVELDSIRFELATRHQRTDREARNAVRRDVLEDYATWDELVCDMEERNVARLVNAFAKIDREGAGPPKDDDLEPIFADYE